MSDGHSYSMAASSATDTSARALPARSARVSPAQSARVLPRASVETPSILDAALPLAARGWQVFPVHPKSKRPLLKGDEGKGGLYLASRDPQQIEKWWRQWPWAMIAVRTGDEFFMVDLDVEEGAGQGAAEARRASVEAEIGCPLPETWCERTPRGGMHLYYRVPQGVTIGNRNGLLSHVDVKGAGGSAIIAPSVRHDGRAYRWIKSPDDIELADPPPALIDLIVKRGRWEQKAERYGPKPDHPRPHATVDDLARRDGLQRYCDAALRNQVEKVTSASRGGRNKALNDAALSLGKIVAALPELLDENTVGSKLFEASGACGLVKDDGAHAVKATIGSGLRAGMKEPIDVFKLGGKKQQGPSATLDDEGYVRELAKQSTLAYAKVRKQEAQKLKIPGRNT